jgi:hypothetical protein
MTADQQLPNLVRLDVDGDDYFVRRTRIISTDRVAYSVWERERGHTTTTRVEWAGIGLRLGLIRSAPIEVATSNEREHHEMVFAIFAARDEVAYDLIFRAYPHIADLERSASMGEIWVTEPREAS